MKKELKKWAQTAAKDAEQEDTAASRALSRAHAALRDEQRARKLAEQEVDIAEKRAAVALALQEAGTKAVVARVKPRGKRPKGKNRGMPFLMCSDWHVEETVDPVTVNNRNEYSPDIAARRADYLATGAVWMVNQWTSGWKIDEMAVWFGGDMITGYIHEELMESNALSPVEAVLLAQELMSNLLDRLLAECRMLTRIHVFCNYGNHGRTGLKRKVSTGAKNSFEWLAYKALAQKYATNDRVRFHVADGAHLYANLYGTGVRLHHGDDIRYQGGVGGLSIPLRKACDSWDEFEQAKLTVIGHWHQFTDYGFAVINGSLIGYNAYALSVKARWEPPAQGIFLIDEEWGKRLVTPLYVDPDRKARAV